MLLMSDVYSKWMIFSRDGVYPITEALPINNAQNKTHHQHQDCFQITSSERVVSTEVPGPMAARWGERMLVNKTRSSTWLLFCPLKWVISIRSVAWLWLECYWLVAVICSLVRHQLSSSSQLRTSFPARARSVCQRNLQIARKYQPIVLVIVPLSRLGST